MAQTQKRPARANGSGLSHNFEKRLASHGSIVTAPEASRQVAPAAWIVRRVPVSLAAARVYAELHGIGAAL